MRTIFSTSLILTILTLRTVTHLVSVASIHVEPMGIYGGKQTSLDAINK